MSKRRIGMCVIAMIALIALVSCDDAHGSTHISANYSQHSRRLEDEAVPPTEDGTEPNPDGTDTQTTTTTTSTTTPSGNTTTTTTNTTSTTPEGSTKYTFNTTTTTTTNENDDDQRQDDSEITAKPSQSSTPVVQTNTSISNVTTTASTNEDGEESEHINDEESEAEDVSDEVLAKHKKAAKKKIYAPELALVDPKPRSFSNYSKVNAPPCGGSEKSFVHYMATPGSRNFIQWKVSHPSVDGNCTVRIGQGLDEDEFFILKPRDGSANKDGSFPCGREIGYEGKEFRFPRNYTCDSCTLQLEWTLATGQIHQCADFIMEDRDAADCAGKCLNGGVCVNGECRCRSGFSGTYCDSKSQVPSRILWYFLIFAIMLAIIGGIIFYTVKVRGQMKSHPALDDDPNSVIGADPEPKRKGRFGF